MLRIETGDVPRGKWAQIYGNPIGDALQLSVIIVYGRDDIGHDLDMHTPLIFSSVGKL
jgi:hypothetical protein